MYLRCVMCKALFKIEGEHAALEKDLKESEWVRCPLCNQPTVRATAIKTGEDPTYDLTAKQFWTASGGFGLPDEVALDLEPVEAMLLAHRASKIKLRRSLTGRVLIDELSLDNGVTLHFTASGEGAVIFKTTRAPMEVEDAG